MKNRLKRTISAVLTLSLLMSICALPSLAAGGEGADSAQGTFELLKNIAVTDSPYTRRGIIPSISTPPRIPTTLT